CFNSLICPSLCAAYLSFHASGGRKGFESEKQDTVKIVGHQYEYKDGVYDSFPCADGLLVDKPLRLVYGLPYHLIVTSADVIHSFHVPSLKLKMDA
ncbi:unnamed protein product, partial [Hymenolepis diminuta]|uniref:COX2_CUA domain-containing protein n=1 Tax=Hymenolepis diminuta TaxID=6216 RepID=A0A0R3SKA0_HYMDI